MSFIKRLAGFVLTVALVVVPTVMRSRQHIELRDTTRLSIRLNWQSDAPPQRDLNTPDSTADDSSAPIAVVQQLHAPRIAPRVHALEQPLAQLPFDNAPEAFRGPPSPTL